MRILKTKLFLTESQLQQMADHYKVGEIKRYRQLVNGEINSNYLVSTKKGKYIFRAYNKSPRKEVDSENIVLKHLSNKGFACPKPLGDIFQVNGVPVNSYQYIEGSVFKRRDVGNIGKIGSFLANLHHHGLNYRFRFAREGEGLNVFKKYLRLKSGKILASSFKSKKSFIQYIKNELSGISFSKKLPKGFVHFDVKPENIIKSSNGKLWLIDFDNCYSDYLIMDIGNTITWWCVDRGWINPEKTAGLIKSYNKVRKLSRLEYEYIPIAVKYCLLKHAFKYAYMGLAHMRFAEKNAYYFLNIYKKWKRHSFYNLYAPGQHRGNKE